MRHYIVITTYAWDAYGMNGALMDVSTGSAEQPLKYNGKELLREWGMDAYRQPFYTSQPQNFAYQRFFP